MQKGLGRIPHHDPRDSLFRIRDYLRPKLVGTVLPESKVWEHGDILDQGNEGSCVGHGWTAWENAKPKGFKRQQDHDYAVGWYERAKELDPWPGTDYEGTATTAGAKVALERGFAEAWLNAGTVDDVYAFLAVEGPVVLGVNWYRSMDRMRSDYYLDVVPSSGIRGGHCVLLIGYLADGSAVCQNSWGLPYGDDGLFYLKKTGFATLLYKNGDAIACVQTGVPPR